MKKRKKVAILGFATGGGGWLEAPFDDDEFEIWAMNHMEVYGEHLKRYDRWFEMHTMYNIKGRKVKLKAYPYNATHYKWLKHVCKVPIYTPKKYGSIKNSIAYPIEKMLKIHGPIFTNTVDYEIALAMEEGFKEIHLYGLAFQYIDEVWTQRLSIAHFMGYAMGKGITFYVPCNNNVLRINNIYSYPTKDIEPYWKYMNTNNIM